MVILSPVRFEWISRWPEVGHKIAKSLLRCIRLLKALDMSLSFGSIVETESSRSRSDTNLPSKTASTRRGERRYECGLWNPSVLVESMYYGPELLVKTNCDKCRSLVRIVRRLKEGTIGKAFENTAALFRWLNQKCEKNNYYFSIQGTQVRLWSNLASCGSLCL